MTGDALLKESANINDTLFQLIQESNFIYAAVSDTRKKKNEVSKITIKPVEIKNTFHLQLTRHFKQKQIHENFELSEGINTISKLLEEDFKQIVIFTYEKDYHIKLGKKGKISISSNPPTKSRRDLSHDKTKNYILSEGVAYPFLVEIGVMDKRGKVFKSKYDKFKQINKFLEIVESSMKTFEKNDKISIVDFGCGKSYLTFALKYYLSDILSYDVEITGLDLKSKVVQECNEIACKLKMDDLSFLNMDIKDYSPSKNVDMVISLHACDIATDMAISKAVQWQSKLILSVPCCQHELFEIISNDDMKAVTRHGILKERLSAMITDAIRAEILEIMGYKVTIMEFIDMEHTPKNLLIRAVYDGETQNGSTERFLSLKNSWSIEKNYLETDLGDLLQKRIKTR